MAKIIHNRKNCIGCGSCEMICPKFWKMDYEDRKSTLVGSVLNKETGNYELEVEDAEDVKANEEVAQTCPVEIVEIES